MKLRIPFFLAILVLITFFSCSKGDLESNHKPTDFKKLAKITSIDPSNGIETTLWEFYYNENNKITRMIENKYNYVVSFDINGKLSEIVKTADDGKRINYSFIYDALGRMIKHIEVQTDKNYPDLKPTITKFYEFDSNHKVVKSSVSNVPTSYNEFVWNGENMIDYKVFNNGILSYSYKTTLNDTKNNPTFEISYVLEPIGFIWSTSRNNPLSQLQISPDGSSTITTSSITYNSLNYPIETISSSQGKVLRKSKFYYIP